MAANFTDVAVVMVPFLAHGHLTPFLRLSRLISSFGIPVHYATTGALNHSLKDRKLEEFPNIHFHDLLVPPAPAPAAAVESGEQSEEDDIANLIATSKLLGEPLCLLCHQLAETCKKLVIVHDTFMLECVQQVHLELTTKLETYVFHGFSAFTLYTWFQQGIRSIQNNNHRFSDFTLYSWFQQGVINNDDDDNNENDNLLLPLEANLPSFETVTSPMFPVFLQWLRDWTSKSAGEIFNSCRDIEGPYLDALAKQSGKPVWDLGPLNPVHVKQNNKHVCIEWLDKQPEHSVVFVSFGTSTTFSPEQINELAIGLERCDQKFIWVLRSKDKLDIGAITTPDSSSGSTLKIELPAGFEERVSKNGTGIIARDWVPQVEILAHPATGGYLFHGGWNSFMESVTMGVPMATWPIHSDQPFNDVLITKVLKIGLVVKDWARRDELVTSNTIENALKTLMSSPEGKEIRQRAIALSKAINTSLSDDGTTRKQTASFIAHITR